MNYKRNRPTRLRRGTTTVEFAFAAPLLLLMTFAAFEFSRANMIFHTAEIAAAAGARNGIVPGAQSSDCHAAAMAEIQAVGVSDATVLVTPTNITESTRQITVTVQVPMTLENGYVIPKFFQGRTVERSVTFSRERDGR